VTDFERVVRPIVPAEIRQPGSFIAEPEAMTEEQRAVLAEVQAKLGEAGLYCFEVKPADEPELLVYDPEQQGNLGMISYEETMRYLSPTGLKPDRDYDRIWRSLRGSSANMLKQQVRWQDYLPLRERQAVLRAARESISGSKDTGVEERLRRVGRLQVEERKIGAEKRKINPQGRELREAPMHKPFVYVRTEAGPQPITTQQNSWTTSIPISHNMTLLHLDHLYHNHRQTPAAGLALRDTRVERLLVDLLNYKIIASERS
jgi:hypothetical protein